MVLSRFEVCINNMTRKEIADRLDKVKAIIIPVAATEQHGPHLPLQHDTAQVSLIAEEAASRMYPRILVTPPVAIGISGHQFLRGGRSLTLTLQPDTFVNIIVDICRSLKYFQIERVLILNGHGGNRVIPPPKLMKTEVYPGLWDLGPPIEEATKRARDMGLKATCTSWWDLIPPETTPSFLEREGPSPGHSGEYETSFGLFMYPKRVKMDLLEKAVKPVRGISKGAHFATKEKGKMLFEEGVNCLVSFLKEFIEDRIEEVYYLPFGEAYGKER